MKKVMTIVMAAALTLAAAGQASAAALETSGEYRARFWYLSNYKSDDNTDFFDQRLRLNGAWNISDGVKVGFRADIVENIWNTSLKTGEEQEIDFDQAYAAIKAGVGTLTVGKQDASWGLGVYTKADNRYRIKYGMKFDQIGVTLLADQFDEEGTLSDDDMGYVIGVTMPAGGWNFGILGLYRDQNPTDATFYALDLTGTGALGPAKVSFEAAWGTGEQGDDDLSGLSAYVGAFMPAGPANVGFEFAYAQGNDQGDTDNEGVIFHDYQGPFNSFILFNNFDLDGYVSNFGSDIGVANAMALKLSGTIAASKQLSFMGAVVYAAADETAEGQDDSMGFEVDLLAKYALTENVTLQAGFGYLSAGDYWGEDPDDPWVGTAHAVVTF